MLLIKPAHFPQLTQLPLPPTHPTLSLSLFPPTDGSGHRLCHFGPDFRLEQRGGAQGGEYLQQHLSHHHNYGHRYKHSNQWI